MPQRPSVLQVSHFHRLPALAKHSSLHLHPSSVVKVFENAVVLAPWLCRRKDCEAHAKQSGKVKRNMAL